MTKFIRLKHGEASFTLEERFDDVKKAANPSTEGEFVDSRIVINLIVEKKERKTVGDL